MVNETSELIQRVRSLIISARKTAARGVNTLQVMANYEIGRMILENEQKGEKRAQYGKHVIGELSDELSEEFGRGFSKRNLEYMRRFYVEWKEEIDSIGGSKYPTIHEDNGFYKVVKNDNKIAQTLSAELGTRLVLSWSHYICLMEIEGLDERRFYEIEAAQNDW